MGETEAERRRAAPQDSQTRGTSPGVHCPTAPLHSAAGAEARQTRFMEQQHAESLLCHTAGAGDEGMKAPQAATKPRGRDQEGSWEEDEEGEEGGAAGDRAWVSSCVPLGVMDSGCIDPTVIGTLYLLHRGGGEKI